jgi:hypothetical protein
MSNKDKINPNSSEQSVVSSSLIYCIQSDILSLAVRLGLTTERQLTDKKTVQTTQVMTDNRCDENNKSEYVECEEEGYDEFDTQEFFDQIDLVDDFICRAVIIDLQDWEENSSKYTTFTFEDSETSEKYTVIDKLDNLLHTIYDYYYTYEVNRYDLLNAMIKCRIEFGMKENDFFGEFEIDRISRHSHQDLAMAEFNRLLEESESY